MAMLGDIQHGRGAALADAESAAGNGRRQGCRVWWRGHKAEGHEEGGNQDAAAWAARFGDAHGSFQLVRPVPAPAELA